MADRAGGEGKPSVPKEVFELDKEHYSYAFVTGYNRDYLWFLSRTPEVSEEAIEAFRRRAKAEGFDFEGLIMVDQSRAE